MLENAYSFIEDSLQKAVLAESNPIQWKFAILNLVQSIELSLKERLKQEHEILIFQNVDKPTFTVTLNTALKRLENISNISFSEHDMKFISDASKIRNEIVHYEFEIDEKQFKLKFAKLLGFLQHFHVVYLDSNLDAEINPDIWQEAISIFDYADELYARAKKIFEDKGFDFDSAWICPRCDFDAVLVESEFASCLVCGYYSDVVKCSSCWELFYKYESKELQTGDEMYEMFCVKCYEDEISADDFYYHEYISHFHNK